MIHLKLTSETPPKTYLFEKKSFFVGHLSSCDSDKLDLILTGDEYSSACLQIEEQDGIVTAYNTTNDPFTTINNIPFAKREISTGDVIEINQSIFVFEGYFADQEEEQEEKKSLCKNDQAVAFEAQKIPQIEMLQKDLHEENIEINDEEIEALLKEVEDLEEMLFPEDSEDQSTHKDPLLPPKETDEVPQAPLVESFSVHSSASHTPPPQCREVKEPLKPLLTKEEDNETDDIQPKEIKIPTQPPSTISWRAFFNFGLSVIILLSTVAVISYSIIVDRSEEEEIKAAAAVADVAMALNFAQINHAKPQNQNWSDPEFLKINLSAVLAADHLPLAHVDSHGQFKNSPYILRIYTGNDLNHFLVIAQPNANLMQWLIPKAAIVLDSQYMKLRKTDDLKTLNRLLIDPTLNASNSANISYFVEQEQLIPISRLRKYYTQSGFNAPKALAMIRPGAENLIYNALRYYRLGESLMKKAITVYESHDNHSDIPLLVQEIDEFMKHPDIVLYTSEGLKTAMLGQKAIATFLPKYNLLFGYLQHNSKQGHLLIDDKNDDRGNEDLSIALQDKLIAENEKKSVDRVSLPPHRENLIEAQEILDILNQKRENDLLRINSALENLMQDESEEMEDKAEMLENLKEERKQIEQAHVNKVLMLLSLISMAETENSKNNKGNAYEEQNKATAEQIKNSNENLDSSEDQEASKEEQHPLHYKLAAVFHAYHAPLHQISNELNIAPNISDGKNGKLPSKSVLAAKYQKTEIELGKKAIASIYTLQKKYRHIPIMQFMHYIKSAGLDPLIQENIQQNADTNGLSSIELENINFYIESIDNSKSLNELDDNLSTLFALLNLEDFISPARLNHHQNRVHASTVRRLDHFFLTSKNTIPQEELGPHNRGRLQDIFKKSWITDNDEVDYYLNEFDLLTSRELLVNP